MEIRHLECFLEIVRLGSFSKAAKALHISQPAASKMIHAMEQELGLPVLYRQNRNLTLTDIGQAVFERAQPIVALFHGLHAELEDVAQARKGRLRIGLPPIASSSVFPQVLGEFSRLYPDISVNLYEFGSKTIEKEVYDGMLDLGVICSPSDNSEFSTLSFIKDPLQVIVAPSHPLSERTLLSFADLAQEQFIMYREDFSLHDAIANRCLQAGFEVRCAYETSQREFMTQLVASGLGIALLPQAICATLSPQQLRAIPMTDPVYLELGAIWRRNRYLSFAARSWLDFTKEKLAPNSTCLTKASTI